MLINYFRLYPTVPFFARQLAQDLDIGKLKYSSSMNQNINSNYKSGKKRVAPKDAVVFIVTFLMHRNAEVFPDPENSIQNVSSLRTTPGSSHSTICLFQAELVTVLVKFWKFCLTQLIFEFWILIDLQVKNLLWWRRKWYWPILCGISKLRQEKDWKMLNLCLKSFCAPKTAFILK